MDLLGPAVREAAAAMQFDYWKRRAAGIKKQKRTGKTDKSTYFLTGIVETQDGNRMSGRQGGHGGRYYAVSKAYMEVSKTMDKDRGYFNAEVLEATVIETLKMCLSETDYLRRRVSEIVKRLLSETYQETEHRKLQAERDKLNQRIRAYLELTPETRSELAPQRLAWEERLATVRKELELIKGGTRSIFKTPAQATENVMKRLVGLGRCIRKMPRSVLNELLGGLVAKAVLNTQTREFHVLFRLPRWMLLSKAPLTSAGGLKMQHKPCSHLQATTENSLILGHFYLDPPHKDWHTWVYDLPRRLPLAEPTKGKEGGTNGREDSDCAVAEGHDRPEHRSGARQQARDRRTNRNRHSRAQRRG